MKKLTILCDLDGIVANLLESWISAANSAHGTSIKREQVDKWEIDQCVPQGRRIYDLLTRELFADLVPIPGAIEALRSFHEVGHEVIVVTASSKDPGVSEAKLRWVLKHLPWLTMDDVFVGSKKHLVRGDALIDDAPKNILAYRKAWPGAAIVTIDYPYNRSTKVQKAVTYRAYSHEDFAAAWADIAHFIRALGETA